MASISLYGYADSISFLISLMHEHWIDFLKDLCCENTHESLLFYTLLYSIIYLYLIMFEFFIVFS